MAISRDNGGSMGTAERKERDRIRRQNEIIDAAEEVFLVKGLEEATMDEIAEKAELSKGTLYIYFKSKEALYMAISLRATSALRRNFEEVLRTGENNEQLLMNLGRAYIEFAGKYPLYFRTMSFVETKEMNFDLGSDPIARQCHEAGMGVLGILAQVIEEGQKEGCFYEEIDPWKTSIVLWASGNGVIQMEQNKGRHFQETHGFTNGFLVEEYMRFCARALLVNHQNID